MLRACLKRFALDGGRCLDRSEPREGDRSFLAVPRVIGLLTSYTADRMSSLPLHILYESETCLVVCKPPGILTQAPPGIDSLVVRIRQYLAGDAPAENVYVGLPHRLDRPASGAICFGKTRKATRRLVRQFERRRVRKVYWACVEGRVDPPAGLWYDLVRKVPGEPRAEISTAESPDSRLAVLRYCTLGTFCWGTHLEIELETGRTHQVRIQAASRGHPVLGDTQYGAQVPFGPQYDDARLRAIALHARRLEFEEPLGGRQVSIIAPLDAAWDELGVRAETPPEQ